MSPKKVDEKFQIREFRIIRTPVSSHLANPFSGNPWPKDIKVHITTKFHIDWIRFWVATVKNIAFLAFLTFPTRFTTLKH